MVAEYQREEISKWSMTKLQSLFAKLCMKIKFLYPRELKLLSCLIAVLFARSDVNYNEYCLTLDHMKKSYRFIFNKENE